VAPGAENFLAWAGSIFWPERLFCRQDINFFFHSTVESRFYGFLGQRQKIHKIEIVHKIETYIKSLQQIPFQPSTTFFCLQQFPQVSSSPIKWNSTTFGQQQCLQVLYFAFFVLDLESNIVVHIPYLIFPCTYIVK